MKKIAVLSGIIFAAAISAYGQWTSQASGFSTVSRGIFDIDVVDQNVVWAAAYDGVTPANPCQDFTRTTDGGTTWTAGTIAAAAGLNFSNISALDANTAWVAMYDGTGGGGSIFKTTDGGGTWVQQNATAFVAPTGFPNVVYFWDSNNGWCFGDPTSGYFEIYTTTDGGTTWTRVPQANIPAPTSGEFGITNFFSVVGNTIWFGTNKGRVFKSTDGGLNWTVATTTLADIGDIVMMDNMNGLARNGTGSSLIKTSDGGATWSAVSFTGNLLTADMDVVPGTNAYISTGNSGGSSYSTDNGSTWVNIDNSGSHLAIAFYDSTTGWCGGFNTSATDSGMFKYTGTALGIKNISEENKFSVNVYPNPFSEKLIVRIVNNEQGIKNYEVSLYDLLGREIISETIRNSDTFVIHGDNIPGGVYFLQVKSDKFTEIRKVEAVK